MMKRRQLLIALVASPLGIARFARAAEPEMTVYKSAT
jgi:hypothetical protein